MSIGEEHLDFIEWTKERGVRIHPNIIPAQIPNSGIGIRALKPLKKGEQLVFIPASALITIDSVGQEFLKECSVQSRIAVHIALDHLQHDRRFFERWSKVWPSLEDLSVLPMTWKESDHEHLTNHAVQLLAKQLAKFERDWEQLRTSAFTPILDKEVYSYYWMIVNTRCFFWEFADIKPKNSETCLAMFPFADYFNHAIQACNINIDEKGVTITTDKEYGTGSEIFVCYGQHNSDFLLVEYGFIPDDNAADNFCIDEIILPEISADAKEDLRGSGYLGEYYLNPSGLCFRTEVALRRHVLNTSAWREFLATGLDLNEGHTVAIQNFSYDLVKNWMRTVGAEHIKELAKVKPRTNSVKLRQKRWEQIQDLISKMERRMGEI
ncbi:SET domain-containing protein [Patellaria atrata CBS 101060]|uniref:SET domain-containing protein n=1 Tax=Patellaria atrata CBS 101060 TaxID=1346257 RepID=A0A9P4SAG1_9PEZI|nr:SET domain-containing protein [Patellaria atrata CBS 101060]